MNAELSKVLAQVYRYADAGFVVVPMNLDGRFVDSEVPR